MKRRRKHIPIGIKLRACLILLKFDPDSDIDWDHFPALGLRQFDEKTGLFTPDELDPRYLRPLARKAHKKKTNGRAGTKRATSYGSDVHAMRKQRHLTKQQEAFRARMLEKAPGEQQPRKSSFPKGRKLRGRAFQKRRAA